ncbi:MAG TPA: hypothetical protein VFL61_12885 [Gaiellaceae bacterium]|nr:hypothetical protein [Gaiellaceae bacterium]
MGITKAVRWFVALALLLSLGTGPSRAGTKPPPAPSDERPPTVVVRVSDTGFHWVDAGLGAAAGFATTLIALGLVLALRPTAEGMTNRMNARVSGKESP